MFSHFPDDFFGRRSIEHVFWSGLIDVTDQFLVQTPSAQFTESRRKATRNVHRYSEQLIFLLPHPSDAIIHGHADPTLVCRVRSPAMPQTAVVHEHASAGHFGSYRSIDIAKGRRKFSGFVRTRNEASGSIFFGKIRNGPHRIAYERNMGPRQRYVLIVRMPRLRRLVFFDRDRRNGRHQKTAIDDTLHERKHQIMGGNPIVGRTECKEVVNPNRTESLKQVLGRLDGPFFLDAKQILGDRVDQFGLDDALENGIPVALDSLYVVFDVEGLRRHGGKYRLGGAREVNRFA